MGRAPVVLAMRLHLGTRLRGGRLLRVRVRGRARSHRRTTGGRRKRQSLGIRCSIRGRCSCIQRATNARNVSTPPSYSFRFCWRSKSERNCPSDRGRFAHACNSVFCRQEHRLQELRPFSPVPQVLGKARQALHRCARLHALGPHLRVLEQAADVPAALARIQAAAVLLRFLITLRRSSPAHCVSAASHRSHTLSACASSPAPAYALVASAPSAASCVLSSAANTARWVVIHPSSWRGGDAPRGPSIGRPAVLEMQRARRCYFSLVRGAM